MRGSHVNITLWVRHSYKYNAGLEIKAFEFLEGMMVCNHQGLPGGTRQSIMLQQLLVPGLLPAVWCESH